jgi:hypothetical protein
LLTGIPKALSSPVQTSVRDVSNLAVALPDTEEKEPDEGLQAFGRMAGFKPGLSAGTATVVEGLLPDSMPKISDVRNASKHRSESETDLVVPPVSENVSGATLLLKSNEGTIAVSQTEAATELGRGTVPTVENSK